MYAVWADGAALGVRGGTRRGRSNTRRADEGCRHYRCAGVCVAVRTVWRRVIGCLVFISHCPLRSPLICGFFAKNELQLKATYDSAPPCSFCSLALSVCWYLHGYMYSRFFAREIGALVRAWYCIFSPAPSACRCVYGCMYCVCMDVCIVCSPMRHRHEVCYGVASVIRID